MENIRVAKRKLVLKLDFTAPTLGEFVVLSAILAFIMTIIDLLGGSKFWQDGDIFVNFIVFFVILWLVSLPVLFLIHHLFNFIRKSLKLNEKKLKIRFSVEKQMNKTRKSKH